MGSGYLAVFAGLEEPALVKPDASTVSLPQAEAPRQGDVSRAQPEVVCYAARARSKRSAFITLVQAATKSVDELLAARRPAA